MSCKNLKFFCVFILTFLVASHSFGQSISDSTDSAGSAVQDSMQINADKDVGDTTVSRIVFENSGDSVRIWKRNPRFAYMAYLDSLLKKKRGTLKADTFSFAKSKGTASTSEGPREQSSPGFLNSEPIRIFFWVVAIFFILFVLYRLVFKGGLFTKGGAKRQDQLPAEEPEKLDNYDAYNSLIHDAEEKSDFNLATRYLYLQSLKKLSDHEFILFSPDKTNSMYVHELSGKIFQSEFGHLTLNYEYIWYGKFSISHDRYLRLKNSFYSFNQKI